MFKKLSTALKGDKVIWRIIFALALFSTLAVYSATGTIAFKYQGGNTMYYVFKHVVILVGALLITYFVHRINYKVFFRLSKILLLIAIPLLLFTLVMGISVNSASRWLTIPGLGLTFQTSDFAKLALIIFTAQVLSKNQEEITDYKKAFLPILGAAGMVCMLIFPANFSTAALLFSVIMVMMFIGRIPVKYLTYLVLAIVAGGVLVGTIIYTVPDLLPRGKTWKKRIETFTGGGNEDATYQSDQAKIAIATGGLLGKGPGNSTQRNFLPEPFSDFIYAIIIEEYGLWGGLIIMSLYMFLLFRAGIIARKSEYAFPALVAFGLTFLLVFQAMINMAVAVNLFPVTGQTLPLVSMGGTSLLFTGVAFGIILSVSRCVDEKEETDAETEDSDDGDEPDTEGDENKKKKASKKRRTKPDADGISTEEDLSDENEDGDEDDYNTDDWDEDSDDEGEESLEESKQEALARKTLEDLQNK